MPTTPDEPPAARRRPLVVLAYGILIRGAGLDVLWPALLKMLILGASLFAIGVLRFRRQFR